MAQVRESSFKRKYVLARFLLLLVAVLTYTRFHEDVVWQYVQRHHDRRLWEHLGFGLAAVLLALGILLSSVTRRSQARSARVQIAVRVLGEFIYAIGLGSLLPWPGLVLLVVGDTALALYNERHRARSIRGLAMHAPARPVVTEATISYCALGSMMIFAITLSDSLAEVLFGAVAALSLYRVYGVWRASLRDAA